MSLDTIVNGTRIGSDIKMSGEALDEYGEMMDRMLSAGERGRTVLTVLYLCVLGLCFVVPIVYYFRMHFEERHARRLRELEIQGITQALEQSQDVHREESRAARRKFRDERKARINQLFAPVKMELKEDNFPHLRAGGMEIAQGSTSELFAMEESTKSMDEDQLFVEVPSPGFQLVSTSVIAGRITNRLVPNVCSICLSNYSVGNTVVWSSNEACEHVFHENCILQWLMKQRDGPLCPCCRRDFVLDPYDMEDLDPTDLNGGQVNPAVGISLLLGSDTVPVEVPTTGTGPEDIVAHQFTSVTTRMEEGLSSTSSHSSTPGNRESGLVDPQRGSNTEGS